ncbi:hypothetical protein ASPWEDRAFT_30770 [Aspergillus wentii DTO 134E9]|uniref:Vacuolar sorting protein Vps3844 C-terminal domain-containing protein n=1 Tax=Aspergillus wentii DTO 134E9 TaxID=1073089 RepID=A0A1L9RA40_ASPWE|nr:uncharacterized protein ASPWEDRAFT_30770 [Aspergillus wentii DTO 134E9]OJJ31794.1 hypothetical protein ASPWEDRAFT_30770 [Aspergillus wentii DTO 134E9]
MLQLSSLLTLSITFALGAGASSASILTFDSNSRGHSLRDWTVSGDAARLVLEHRTKSPDASFLGETDQNTVDLLNLAGGTPSPLFGATAGNAQNLKSVLILEGLGSKVGSFLQENYPGNLSIAPSFLLDDYALASSFRGGPKTQPVKRRCLFHSHNRADSSKDIQVAEYCLANYPISQGVPHFHSKELLSHVDLLESWVDESASTTVLKVSLKPQNKHADSASITHVLKSLLEGLSTLSSSSEGNQITTLVFSESRDSLESKRSMWPRSINKEQTLSRLAGSAADWQSSRFLSRSEQQIIPSNLIPVCHASESSCTEATNSCSGHGSCYRKFGLGNTEASSECYACKCQETILKKADGTVQKVRWGGSACQKRDISSPFFLITGISIMILAAVGTAVGMLFSIGQDELPGVIGAGVGAPKAQK